MGRRKTDHEIVVTVAPKSRLGAKHAEFLAGEIAGALHGLSIVQVTLAGEWNQTNAADERRERFDRLLRLAAAGVRVLVEIAEEE